MGNNGAAAKVVLQRHFLAESKSAAARHPTSHDAKRLLIKSHHLS